MRSGPGRGVLTGYGSLLSADRLSSSCRPLESLEAVNAVCTSLCWQSADGSADRSVLDLHAAGYLGAVLGLLRHDADQETLGVVRLTLGPAHTDPG